ncbi:MAG: hypothetical protein K5874_09055 [Bacteroidaceae bacterium]|nr:hypothetical protein [Bacteroidaceae bacterium]MCR4770340.1 hypothetical protein [Bacteroidaceae bacterium]
MENELLIQAISQILQNEASEDTLKIKNKILERIALEADVKASRIPAPLNITQIGGYINLLRKLDKEEQERQTKQKTAYQQMLEQTLTSILGLPVQPPTE